MVYVHFDQSNAITINLMNAMYLLKMNDFAFKMEIIFLPRNHHRRSRFNSRAKTRIIGRNLGE